MKKVWSVKSLSRVRFFVNPWTAICQAALSIKFSRQEYWSGYPFPSPRDLPDPGIKPGSSELQVDFYRLSHQGRPGTPPNQYSAQWLQHNPPGCFPILMVPSAVHQCRSAAGISESETFSPVSMIISHMIISNSCLFTEEGDKTQLFERTAASTSERVCFFAFLP